MPSIGELFVTLGAKTDASMQAGLRKLQELGTTAQRMTQQMNASARMSAQMWGAVTRELGGANAGMRSLGSTSRSTANEIRNISKAMKNAALDAKMMASSASSAVQRNLVAVRSSLESARVAGLARGGGGRSGINWGAVGDPFNPSGQKQAIKEALQNSALVNNMRKGRSAGNDALAEFWATVSGAPDSEHHPLLAPGRSRNSFRNMMGFKPVTGGGGGNINWGSATGDPFNTGGVGGGGGGRTVGRRGGGGRGGGGGGFNRPLGPIGDISAFRRVILGAGIYQAVTGIGELADTYTRLQMRVAQVTTTQQEADDTFNRLRGIARETKADLETTTEAYVRIKNATEGMKLSQEDTYKFVERLNMAIGTSGASASEARSGMMQLTQALAKGKLDGDEFRSIAENMPNILKILEKQMHKTEAQLRAMSHSGELTRESIVKAFLATNDLKAPPDTFASAWTNFKNDMLVLVGTMAKDAKLVQAFKDILSAMAKIFTALAPIIAKVVVYLAEFIKDLANGEPYARALAFVLATLLLPQLAAMVMWMGRLAAMPFTAIIGQIGKIRALMGFGGTSTLTGVAAGSTGAGGAGAGTAAAGASGLAGLSAAAGPIALGLAAIHAVNPEGGPGKYFGAIGAGFDQLNKYQGDGTASDVFKMFANEKATTPPPSVNVAPTTVNIYVKDLEEAQDKFSQEMVDRMMRHAAGAVNRSGS